MSELSQSFRTMNDPYYGAESFIPKPIVSKTSLMSNYSGGNPECSTYDGRPVWERLTTIEERKDYYIKCLTEEIGSKLTLEELDKLAQIISVGDGAILQAKFVELVKSMWWKKQPW